MATLKIEAKYFPLFYTLFITSGFVICFGLAIVMHWSQVVKNHCRVWEFLPSVSAVIGDHKPEMNVWRVAIALGSGPRFVSSLLNYKILVDSLASQKSLIKSALVVDLLRIGAAGGWTYISSSEYNFEHSVCFVLYVLFSLIYMTIHTPLFYKAKIASPSSSTTTKGHTRLSGIAQKSYKWKAICFGGHIVFFLISLYFFLIEHQKHCMPGGYSRYALCEWILSAFNILL
jgi:hypothetical protein